MNKWIITSDDYWVNKWDQFLFNSSQAVFLQSSQRVKSYGSYGAKAELLLYVNSRQEIICGSANILVQFKFLRIYSCSFGPIVANDIFFNDELFREYISQFRDRGEELKAFSSEITTPVTNHPPSNKSFNEGQIFNKLPKYELVNLISLKDSEDKYRSVETIIESFSKKARRDVRASYRRGLSSRIVTQHDEIEKAYGCIESNGTNKGYDVRSWGQFGHNVITMIDKGHACMLTAWLGDEIQGALLLERGGNVLNYTMGGVLRHKPDLNTGYFLQAEAIKQAINLDMDFYNISYYGPPEVMKFKKSFNPSLLQLGKSYYFVNNHVLYFLYKKLYGKFGKKVLSWLLKFSKGSKA